MRPPNLRRWPENRNHKHRWNIHKTHCVWECGNDIPHQNKLKQNHNSGQKKRQNNQRIPKTNPREIPGVNFQINGDLIGQEIGLRKPTHNAVIKRLDNGNTWQLCKKRIFPDPEIANKIKIDLWGAAIGSVFKYGLSLLHINEREDIKLKQFATKRLGRIAKQYQNAENQEENKELIETLTIENKITGLRRARKVPTSRSRLHVAKIGDIYRWKTALSPAYLNDAQDYNIELQILERKWIRMKTLYNKKKINSEEAQHHTWNLQTHGAKTPTT